MMPALSLHQPWAQLVVIGTKTLETRSWACPEKYWGQRMAFHATLRGIDKPTNDADRLIGEFRKEDGRTLSHPSLGVIDLPLGAVVGSGIVTACYPIVEHTGEYDDEIYTTIDGRNLFRQRVIGDPSIVSNVRQEDISDQLPYGDFTSGRYAWLIEDAAPTTERCPWCWGTKYIRGFAVDGVMGGMRPAAVRCPVCAGTGRCGPIPAKGKQRVWNWTPEAVAA